METRSRVYPRITSTGSPAESTIAQESKPPPKFLGTGKKPYPSIEIPSVSDLGLSSDGRVSSARLPSKEITPNMAELVPRIPNERKRTVPTVEKQSTSRLTTSSDGRAFSTWSQTSEITSGTTELPSEMFGERIRRYPTVEQHSVSHLSASSGGEASILKSPPSEIKPNIQKLPLQSPSAEEQSSNDDSAESDQESVIFCGAVESHKRSKVPNPKKFSSRRTKAEKQELAVSCYRGSEKGAS